jgi:hypothetical protein
MLTTDLQLNSDKFKAGLPNRIIKDDPFEFSEKLNRLPFSFSHDLGEHPLFEISRLVELAATILQAENKVQHPTLKSDDLIPFGGVHCQVGKVPVHFKWGDVAVKEQLLEQMKSIEKSDSWLLLFSVQRDPEYKALLHRIVAELEELTGRPLQEEITALDAYIFVASPHSVTPYHIDHESTFLFQIHGERESNLFNRYEDAVITEQELEEFYTGNLSAANYREEFQSKAYVYPLVPGKGVHHPVCAPHWYKNGNSYSVALGIHLGLRSFDLQARVYQVNHYLRKLGLSPFPPGKSVLRDRIKIFVIGLFSKRRPETKIEVVRSGIDRIHSIAKQAFALIKVARQMLGRLR